MSTKWNELRVWNSETGIDNPVAITPELARELRDTGGIDGWFLTPCLDDRVNPADPFDSENYTDPANFGPSDDEIDWDGLGREYKIAVAREDGSFHVLDEFEAENDDEADAYADENYPDTEWYVLDSDDDNING